MYVFAFIFGQVSVLQIYFKYEGSHFRVHFIYNFGNRNDS